MRMSAEECSFFPYHTIMSCKTRRRLVTPSASPLPGSMSANVQDDSLPSLKCSAETGHSAASSGRRPAINLVICASGKEL